MTEKELRNPERTLAVKGFNVESVAFERLHGQPRGWDVFASRGWEHAHTDDIVDDDGFL